MIVASFILIISTAMLLFYFQATCQSILRRKFDQEYAYTIVNANRLEFPAVQKAIEQLDEPVDYARLRMTLKCDFLALTYLLKNAGNLKQSYSRDELFLMLYFRATLAALRIRHIFRLKEKGSVLKLASVLEYFANVVGQRVNRVRFGNLTPTDYLLSL